MAERKSKIKNQKSKISRKSKVKVARKKKTARKRPVKFSRSRKKTLIPIGGMSFGSGIMMRSPNYMAIAVRDDVGRIELSSFKIKDIRNRYPFLLLPFVRGAFYLIENLFFLVKVAFYKRSFEKRLLKEKTRIQRIISRGNKYLIYIMYVLLFVAFFSYANTRLGSLAVSDWNSFFINFIFILLFILFFILLFILVALNRHDKLEILEYHSTEHKIINAYEHKKSITEEEIEKSSSLHDRCGSFVAFWTVVIFSLFLAFLRVSAYSWFFGFIVSLGLMLISFSVAYEFVRFIIVCRNRFLTSVFLKPLYLIQFLLVYSPDKRHINTGLVAFREIMRLERSR